VCDEKANVCEPLLTHRNVGGGIGTGEVHGPGSTAGRGRCAQWRYRKITDRGSGRSGCRIRRTRIAQTAAAMLLEEKLGPIFYSDSYGYRPGRSAHDALAVTRERCWRKDWVLDLDIRAFFDSVP
jgi:Reverse transcriptase (RNA-dependent DNA polymerase)